MTFYSLTSYQMQKLGLLRVLQICVHNYRDIGAYDIAMLKTAKNIVYNNAVSPIEVPLSMGSLRTQDKTQNLILAGWGVLETTSFIPALPDKLQEARVEYLPFEGKGLLYLIVLFLLEDLSDKKKP